MGQARVLIALSTITEHRGRYFVAIVCLSSLAEKSNVVTTGAPFVHGAPPSGTHIL